MSKDPSLFTQFEVPFDRSEFEPRQPTSDAPEPTAINYSSRIPAYFRAHPGEWISMQTLAKIGGTGGWRSRVSDCRTKLGMHIENRQPRVRVASGETITQSEYRYLPEGESA
jgi:hypothetical protein